MGSTPSSRVIDATIANPIVFSEMLLPLKSVQPDAKGLTYKLLPDSEDITLIRNFLKQTGRGVPDDAHIVLSAGGSTQMIAACYWSISKILNRNIRIQNILEPPFYNLHRDIADIVKGSEWVESKTPLSMVDVQLIVSPNNPTGHVSVPTVPVTSDKFILLDSVLDYPQFTGVNTANPWTVDYYKEHKRFCVVGSLSKLGLGGLRIGYAITKNKELADYMTKYVQDSSVGTNAWSMSGAKSILPSITPSLLQQMYRLIKRRYSEILNIIPSELILSVGRDVPFILVNITPDTFKELGIKVSSGVGYSSSPSYSRLQLMVSNDDWIILLRRLRSHFVPK